MPVFSTVVRELTARLLRQFQGLAGARQPGAAFDIDIVYPDAAVYRGLQAGIDRDVALAPPQAFLDLALALPPAVGFWQGDEFGATGLKILPQGKTDRGIGTYQQNPHRRFARVQ